MCFTIKRISLLLNKVISKPTMTNPGTWADRRIQERWGHQSAPEGGGVASFPAYRPDHPSLQWAEAGHQCRQQSESGNGSKFEKIKINKKDLKNQSRPWTYYW